MNGENDCMPWTRLLENIHIHVWGNDENLHLFGLELHDLHYLAHTVHVRWDTFLEYGLKFQQSHQVEILRKPDALQWYFIRIA